MVKFVELDKFKLYLTKVNITNINVKSEEGVANLPL